MAELLSSLTHWQQVIGWLLIVQSALLVLAVGIAAATFYVTWQVYRDVHLPQR